MSSDDNADRIMRDIECLLREWDVREVMTAQPLQGREALLMVLNWEQPEKVKWDEEGF